MTQLSSDIALSDGVKKREIVAMENFNKDFERKISSIVVHVAVVLQVYASILKVK